MTIDHVLGEVETRRKVILWRATHRGTKEMDLALGGFVRDTIDSMQLSELNELEALIALPDPLLMAWLLGEEPVSGDHRNATTERFLAYRVRLL
jgi:antitoxin CptB